MSFKNRRQFLKSATRAAGAAAALTAMPPSIRRALAIPAANDTRSIADVQHVVILMQENRSFDHYFGTMRGVRGFGDRHAIPMTGGKVVWQQSDGNKDIPPYHLDTKTTSALRVPGTPHSFSDAQAAWSQGKFGLWPKHKTQFAMGHYRREDIPFQFALAEAFTICDAYHCSIASGTDPNRIVFWSGSNFNPEVRARGENCTDADSEPNNLRCWIKGTLPEPGYTYQGSAFRWATIPDVLEKAGIHWRIYQDPNNNWTGAMHGGLAFESFRTAEPDSPLYKRGMSHWSLEQLAKDVKENKLPQVSWVLPPAQWSEHPSASSPLQGAEFTARILNALTANPAAWSKTVVFLTFDENDGFFDHVPPPAVPSYNADGTLAGKATLDLRGEYFDDHLGKYRDASDQISGQIRPWGLGPRVPMYVVSPWSKGGWVNSQVFDHTSVGRFLERRFDVLLPGISPWARAISGDLTSAFDFVRPNDPVFEKLPEITNSAAVAKEHSTRPKPVPPAVAGKPYQETGTRPSRALPYEMEVRAEVAPESGVTLTFENSGAQGAVFHVYDRLYLERIPRRYTVEAGKKLSDRWDLVEGAYDLWVYAPNGFLREFRDRIRDKAEMLPEIQLRYLPEKATIGAFVPPGTGTQVVVKANAYRRDGPWKVSAGDPEHLWNVAEYGNWYDFTATVEGREEYARRFAGRLETGRDSISDPAMG